MGTGIVRRLAAGLTIACLAMLVNPCRAQPAEEPPVLQLDGSETLRPMTGHAQVLEDKSAKLGLDQVRATREGWQPGHPTNLSFGMNYSAWWVRWRIENPTGQTVRNVIDLGAPVEDYVSWYVVRDGGKKIESTHTGDRVPYAQRPLPVRTLALPLELAPHEKIELWLRVGTEYGVFGPMPIKASSNAQFIAINERISHTLSIFFGAMLALASYNFAVFLSTREKVFGYYVVYLASLSLWGYSITGFAFANLWPDSPAFGNQLPLFLAVLTAVSLLVFSSAYLRLRTDAPRWLWRTHQVAIAINCLVWIPAILGQFALTTVLTMLLPAPTLLLQLFTGLYLLRRGSRPARFFVGAFAMLAIGIIGFVLQLMKVLPVNFFTTWGIPIGSCLEALVLALGLADAMNTLKAEKLAAERKTLQAQQALNEKLEDQVAARTKELERANQRLREMAITDVLTGAYNRRHFNEICDIALAGRRRADSVSFCMCDIDFFKLYNDRYGHQAGDEALRRTAAALQAELKRSGDALFRLGGEEFGVLFTANTAEAAKDYVERLRAAVQAMQIPHEGNPNGVITASFGVVWWDAEHASDLTAEAMYQLADRMLYAAKAEGRNRVEMHPGAIKRVA